MKNIELKKNKIIQNILASIIGIPTEFALGMVAAPLIGGSVAFFFKFRVARSLITGGISYLISDSIKSEIWIAKTKICNYTAQEGHEICAARTF